MITDESLQLKHSGTLEEGHGKNERFILAMDSQVAGYGELALSFLGLW